MTVTEHLIAPCIFQPLCNCFYKQQVVRERQVYREAEIKFRRKLVETDFVVSRNPLVA